jgi:hypothetical protein
VFFLFVRNGTTAAALGYLFATEQDLGIRVFVAGVAVVYAIAEVFVNYTFAEAAEEHGPSPSN